MTEQLQGQPFWEAWGLPAPGTSITQHAFQSLPETHFYVEFVDGIVIYPHWNEETMSPSPIPDHQDVVGNVYVWLRDYSKQHGGTAHVAPLDLVLREEVIVQPDVMWRSSDSACVRTETHLRGAPELVVEVLSPATAIRDKIEKFDLYESHGVGEYWLLDPRDNLIEVYVLEDDRFWRLGAFSIEQLFESPVLSTTVNAATLFED